MKIFVCDRSKVAKTMARFSATHVLSLLDPGVRPFLNPHFNKANWRLVICEDQLNADDPNAPTLENVEFILDWGRTLPDDAVVLVHCEAGISRSTAAAMALLIQHKGIEHIDECVAEILAVRPNACPNPLITIYADNILKCGGKFHSAAEDIATAHIFKMIHN